MPTYRFDLKEEYGKRLEKDAEDSMMTVQDYIRSRLFPAEDIFTMLELVKRIKAKGPFEFTISDLYSDEEWSSVDRSVAGVLGKNFYKFTSTHPDLGISLIPSRTLFLIRLLKSIAFFFAVMLYNYVHYFSIMLWRIYNYEKNSTYVH